MQAKENLDRVYQAHSPEELKQAYSSWAKSYDRDLVEGMGWDKPARVGQVLLPFLPPQARILDVAAGTGLMGQFLAGQGYHDLTALDFSPDMLAQARQRNVYRELLEIDLNLPIPLPDGGFDALTAVGIFTEGHVGPECLAELGRLVRGGGLVAFSLRDDLHSRYAAALQALPWQLVQHQEFSDGLESRPWSVWVYSV